MFMLCNISTKCCFFEQAALEKLLPQFLDLVALSADPSEYDEKVQGAQSLISDLRNLIVAFDKLLPEQVADDILRNYEDLVFKI